MSLLNLFQESNSLWLLESLAHVLWQGVLIAAAAAILAALLKNHSAQSRYLVYCAALYLTLTGLPLNLWYLHQQHPATSAAQQPVPNGLVAEALTSPTGILVDPQAEPGTAAAQPINGMGEPHPSTRIVSPRTDANGSISFLQRHARWLSAAYLLGTLAMTVRLVAGLISSQRLRSAGRPVRDTCVLDVMRLATEELGFRIAPVVSYCARMTSPVVVGVVKPAILLPTAILSELTPAQVESLLLHELAHIRRYDHLVNLAQRIIEAVLFFHPAVWWLSHRVRVEREHCCDDLAIRWGSEPCDYAESLVIASEYRLRPLGYSDPNLAMLAATGDKPSQLRGRVSRILGIPLPGPGVGLTRVGMASLVAIGLASAILLAVQPDGARHDLADFDFSDPPGAYEKGIEVANRDQRFTVDGVRFRAGPLKWVKQPNGAGEELQMDLGVADGYEVVEVRLFDHATRELIHDSAWQHADPHKHDFFIERIGSTNLVRIREVNGILPDKIDVWLRIATSRGGNTLVLNAKEGAAAKTGNSEIVITKLLPGAMNGTGGPSRQMQWDLTTVHNEDRQLTLNLENRGDLLKGRYHLVAVKKNDSRHPMDHTHFRDFRNMGRRTYVHMDVALPDADHFELIPFKARHKFFFNGLDVPLNAAEPIEPGEPAGTPPDLEFTGGIWNFPLDQFVPREDWQKISAINLEKLDASFRLPWDENGPAVFEAEGKGHLFVPEQDVIIPLNGVLVAPLTLKEVKPEFTMQTRVRKGLEGRTLEQIIGDIKEWNARHDGTTQHQLIPEEHYAALVSGRSVVVMGVHGTPGDMWVQFIPIGKVANNAPSLSNWRECTLHDLESGAVGGALNLNRSTMQTLDQNRWRNPGPDALLVAEFAKNKLTLAVPGAEKFVLLNTKIDVTAFEIAHHLDVAQGIDPKLVSHDITASDDAIFHTFDNPIRARSFALATRTPDGEPVAGQITVEEVDRQKQTMKIRYRLFDTDIAARLTADKDDPEARNYPDLYIAGPAVGFTQEQVRSWVDSHIRADFPNKSYQPLEWGEPQTIKPFAWVVIRVKYISPVRPTAKKRYLSHRYYTFTLEGEFVRSDYVDGPRTEITENSHLLGTLSKPGNVTNPVAPTASNGMKHTHRFIVRTSTGQKLRWDRLQPDNEHARALREWDKKPYEQAREAGIKTTSELPDLWMKVPSGSESYEVRPEVQLIRVAFDTEIFYRPDLKRFWVKRDPTYSSLITFFGPFKGDPHEVLQITSHAEANAIPFDLFWPGGRFLDIALGDKREDILKRWGEPSGTSTSFARRIRTDSYPPDRNLLYHDDQLVRIRIGTVGPFKTRFDNGFDSAITREQVVAELGMPEDTSRKRVSYRSGGLLLDVTLDEENPSIQVSGSGPGLDLSKRDMDAPHEARMRLPQGEISYIRFSQDGAVGTIALGDSMKDVVAEVGPAGDVRSFHGGRDWTYYYDNGNLQFRSGRLDAITLRLYGTDVSFDNGLSGELSIEQARVLLSANATEMPPSRPRGSYSFINEESIISAYFMREGKYFPKNDIEEQAAPLTKLSVQRRAAPP